MDFAFVLTADSGDLGEQAKYCIRSIRNFHPDSPIYVGSPPHKDLPIEISEKATKIFDVSIPIPEYPITHKVATLASVQNNTEEQGYILLDSDTLLVDEFIQPSFEGLAAAPEPYVANHWTKRSRSDWKNLACTYGFEIPDEELTTPMNNRKMVPYYNSGVVLTTESEFGNKWLELTINLYQDEIPDRWFSDQVALSLLSFERDMISLPMIYNWPVDAHIPWLTDAIILHYHRPTWLLTAVDKQEIIKRLGLADLINYTYTDPRFPIFALRMFLKHILILGAFNNTNFMFPRKKAIKNKMQQFKKSFSFI